MIKVEKLKDGAKVFIMREGKRTQVLLNQLISHAEFTTIEVEGGTLVYSVDETDVLEMVGGEGKQIDLNLSETIADTVVTQEAITTDGVERMRITAETTEVAEVPVETPAEAPAPTEVPATPTIVIPTPRAKK